MIQTKEKRYQMAYVELLEIINHLSARDQSKIPDKFKGNLQENMDKEYKFYYDEKKELSNQNYMNETKALYINLYRQYLADDNEVWKKYDKICFNLIEEEKKKKYDSNNMFKTSKEYIENKNQNNALVAVEDSKFKIFVKKIKNYFSTIISKFK